MARWAIDSLLMAEGERCTDFQLPLQCGNDIIQYPGNSSFTFCECCDNRVK